METRTYWLSFCDPAKPQGQCFLGVIVVDVTREEADRALALQPWMHNRVEGPWLAAATQSCWKAGINPGGEILFAHISSDAPIPRMTLLDKTAVEEWGTAARRTRQRSVDAILRRKYYVWMRGFHDIRPCSRCGQNEAAYLHIAWLVRWPTLCEDCYRDVD